MPELPTYVDTLRTIWNRSGYDKGFISNPFAGDDAARLGLVRTQALLIHLGYDPLPYAIVHVAGSKGKGSTCVMIDSILRSAGVRTGRYMSPQLHSFRERFVINGAMISEDDFIDLTQRFLAAADDIENAQPEIGPITAFELSTAMALGWFAEQQCDVAVVEVGLGGTLDATNIVTPTLSVITTLDYEHTAILGETLTEIAGNKAGTIKPDRPVMTAAQQDEALEVIRHRAIEAHSPLKIAGIDWTVHGTDREFTYDDGQHHLDHLQLALLGDHQVANAGLAVATVLELRQAIQINDAAIREGLSKAVLPARFEQTRLAGGTRVVIDGAHTPASSQALATALHAHFPDHMFTLIIGMLADKSPEAMLTPLLRHADRVIAVQPQNPRAMPASDLAQAIERLGGQVVIAPSVEAALAEAGSEIVVITGSFTTAAEARVALGLAEFVDPPIT
ncbi:MAG: bifunctional folylpolyglutamate synthase/dihydrofolate synthase [Thermomicrobiales bacterium]|nr:bifunctional folylpolyglutamate synthase/dihydrofolate synthase [Thermomicrobiales bacterium]